jgi:predicted DNA-binding antitoxin AbrB/MazE fold protein
MAKLRVRYENGQFVPMEPVQGLQDGDEFEIEYTPHEITPESQMETLKRTAGMWADVEGIKEYLESVRQQWDDEWQRRISSL